jgi:DNA-binding MarR family transcriptional regulator
MSDHLNSSVVRWVALAGREVLLAYERTVGMSETRFRVLEAIADQNANMAEIQERARLDQSVVSRMMRSLEEEGIVMRPDPDSYRDRRHALTAAGRALYKAAAARTSVFEQALTAALSPQSRRGAVEALRAACAVAASFNEDKTRL